MSMTEHAANLLANLRKTTESLAYLQLHGEMESAAREMLAVCAHSIQRDISALERALLQEDACPGEGLPDTAPLH